MVHICTDGSTYVGLPSGAAFIFLDDDFWDKEYWPNAQYWRLPQTDNYLAELSAINRSLRAVSVDTPLTIHTDSESSIRAIETYLGNPEISTRLLRKNARPYLRAITRAINARKARGTPTRLEHVRSHTGLREVYSAGNEAADRCAKWAALLGKYGRNGVVDERDQKGLVDINLLHNELKFVLYDQISEPIHGDIRTAMKDALTTDKISEWADEKQRPKRGQLVREEIGTVELIDSVHKSLKHPSDIKFLLQIVSQAEDRVWIGKKEKTIAICDRCNAGLENTNEHKLIGCQANTDLWNQAEAAIWEILQGDTTTTHNTMTDTAKELLKSLPAEHKTQCPEITNESLEKLAHIYAEKEIITYPDRTKTNTKEFAKLVKALRAKHACECGRFRHNHDCPGRERTLPNLLDKGLHRILTAQLDTPNAVLENVFQISEGTDNWAASYPATHLSTLLGARNEVRDLTNRHTWLGFRRHTTHKEMFSIMVAALESTGSMRAIRLRDNREPDKPLQSSPEWNVRVYTLGTLRLKEKAKGKHSEQPSPRRTIAIDIIENHEAKDFQYNQIQESLQKMVASQTDKYEELTLTTRPPPHLTEEKTQQEIMQTLTLRAPISARPTLCWYRPDHPTIKRDISYKANALEGHLRIKGLLGIFPKGFMGHLIKMGHDPQWVTSENISKIRNIITDTSRLAFARYEMWKKNKRKTRGRRKKKPK
jgi:ribonuclease HI